jgi:hypothetical protein
VFMVILWGVRDYDPYFQYRSDATGKLGFTSYQKCSAVIRMLLYGMYGDIFYEYLRMSESTCRESMYQFCRALNGLFGELYLRAPTIKGTRGSLPINGARGCRALSVASIARIDSGRSVHLHGSVSTTVIPRDALLF